MSRMQTQSGADKGKTMTDNTTEELLELARQRIAERHVQEQQQREKARIERGRSWGAVFLGIAGALILALLFTPGMPLEWKMYAVVHGVCAQVHNIFLGGKQFPLCARNSGIYISVVITTLYVWARGRGRAGRIPPWPVAAVLGAFVLIMALDGFNSMFLDMKAPYLYTPRNDVRTLTGMGMGITIAVMLMLIFNLALRQDVDRQQPILAGWLDLGALLVMNFLVLVAIYGNLSLMFWPLAAFAFLGITGVLYAVILLLVSLFMGYSGIVTNVRQLARPAVIALVPTGIVLATFSFLRFWMEAQGLMG